jgi:hypothetical protein
MLSVSDSAGRVGSDGPGPTDPDISRISYGFGTKGTQIQTTLTGTNFTTTPTKQRMGDLE